MTLLSLPVGVRAERLVREILADAQWHPAANVQRECAERARVNARAVQRARLRLGVELRRSGYPSKTEWRWPPDASRDSQPADGPDDPRDAGRDAAEEVLRELLGDREWHAVEELEVVSAARDVDSSAVQRAGFALGVEHRRAPETDRVEWRLDDRPKLTHEGPHQFETPPPGWGVDLSGPWGEKW